MAHALLVGESRIWPGVSQVLTQHSNHVTLVASNPDEWVLAQSLAAANPTMIFPVQANGQEPESAVIAAQAGAARFGPVTLVLHELWDEALSRTRALVEWLEKTSPVCRFFQIVEGMGKISVEWESALVDYFKSFTRVLGRIVLLGYGKKDKEIPEDALCQGVVDAIREDHHKAVIGNEFASS